jgi:hypothetical protein
MSLSFDGDGKADIALGVHSATVLRANDFVL